MKANQRELAPVFFGSLPSRVESNAERKLELDEVASVIENNSRKQTKRGPSDNFSRVILAGTNLYYPEAAKKR